MSEAVMLTKAEKFAKDPDSFVCMSDLVCGVMKTDKGMATYLGPCSRLDYEIAQSRLNYKIGQAFQYMDMAAAQKEVSPIITPGAR